MILIIFQSFVDTRVWHLAWLFRCLLWIPGLNRVSVWSGSNECLYHLVRDGICVWLLVLTRICNQPGLIGYLCGNYTWYVYSNYLWVSSGKDTGCVPSAPIDLNQQPWVTECTHSMVTLLTKYVNSKYYSRVLLACATRISATLTTDKHTDNNCDLLI